MKLTEAKIRIDQQSHATRTSSTGTFPKETYSVYYDLSFYATDVYKIDEMYEKIADEYLHKMGLNIGIKQMLREAYPDLLI